MNNILLPITDICNQKCLFCSAYGRADRVNSHYFYERIKLATGRLVISGGEPTLSRDLFWAINKAKERGLTVELQSNASTFFYHDFTDRLIYSGIDLFNVNLPAHIASIHDPLTQTKGLLALKISGLRYLLKKKATLRLTFVINMLNYKIAPDFASFVASKLAGTAMLQFSFIKLMGLATANARLIPAYKAVQPFLLKALSICKKHRIKTLVDHVPLCFIKGFETHHVDFQKIQSGEPLQEARLEKTKLKKCFTCKQAHHCCGVRKDHFANAKNKLSVSPF